MSRVLFIIYDIYADSLRADESEAGIYDICWIDNLSIAVLI
jgi:hypothetical protein